MHYFLPDTPPDWRAAAPDERFRRVGRGTLQGTLPCGRDEMKVSTWNKARVTGSVAVRKPKRPKTRLPSTALACRLLRHHPLSRPGAAR